MTKPLLSFDAAKMRLMTTPLKALGTEWLTLDTALNRIAAQDICAPIDVPQFTNAAMDGFAIRLQDLTKYESLRIEATILAGQTAPKHWTPGSCFKIMTGAMLPEQADAVVMREQATEQNGHVYFAKKPQRHQNIRFSGEDVRQGSPILSQGQCLTLPLLTQLSTLGIAQVEVVKPVRVALLSTGNELAPLGTALAPGQIYDSNRLMLKLLLQRLGCQVIDLGIAQDNKASIKALLEKAAQTADIIITSGGVSVGDADHTYTAVMESGQIHFWKIAMKPGKPFAYGQIGSALFCGLPGNPVSAFTVFYQLVQPLIVRLAGQKQPSWCQLPSAKVRTLHKLHKTAGRLDFQRGRLVRLPSGEFGVESTGSQGSHLMHSLTVANCFIILTAEQTEVEAGELVTVEPFNYPLG